MKIVIENGNGKVNKFEPKEKLDLLKSFVPEGDVEGQEAVDVMKKFISTSDYVIFNLITTLFDKSIDSYKGLNDEEFIHLVCKNTGLSRADYLSIMKLDNESLSKVMLENVKKYFEKPYREEEHKIVYSRFIPTDADKAFYQLLNTFNIKDIRGGRILGFGRNDQHNIIISWCEGDHYLIVCDSKETYNEVIADEINNLKEQYGY